LAPLGASHLLKGHWDHFEAVVQSAFLPTAIPALADIDDYRLIRDLPVLHERTWRR
jgi:hypothetical protein